MNRSLARTLAIARRQWHNLRYRQPPPNQPCSTEEFCRDRSLPFRQLRARQEIRRPPPPPAEDGMDWKFRAESVRVSPPVYFAELPGMCVTLCGYVFSEDGLLLADASNQIGAEPDRHSLLHGGRLPTPEPVEGTVAVLDVSHGQNYFHFLFDSLPRLEFLPPGRKPDFYYVRTSHSFHREYLARAGVEADRILAAEAHPIVKARQLWLPSLPGSSGNPTPTSRDFLRRLRPAPARTSPQPGNNKIYISRGDVKSRVFPNEPEIRSFLEDRGFVPVQLSGKSVEDQMRLFAEAEIVVSPHGAGLSNLVFAEPGTAVVELFSPDYFNVCYWALADLCGLRYFHLTAGRPPEEHYRRSLGRSWRRPSISLSALKELLENIA